MKSIVPAEFVTLMRSLEFDITAKLAFFKRIAKDMYLSISHFEFLEFRLRMIYVFHDTRHRCSPDCSEYLRKHLKMVAKVLDSHDYALFLFIAERYAVQGLGNFDNFWLTIVSKLLNLKSMREDEDAWKCSGTDFKSRCEATLHSNSWWNDINEIYCSSVGEFKRQPGSDQCFDEKLDDLDFMYRTYHAKNTMASLASLLPENDKVEFLVHWL